MSSSFAFLFDFDSTIISVESLDEIIKLSLCDSSESRTTLKQIEQITNQGMAGEIDLLESISSRLKIAGIKKAHIETFKKQVPRFITPGITEVVQFLQHQKASLFIISGGFRECIFPVAQKLQIPDDHCFGNVFLFDENDRVIGVEKNNPLCRSDGKTRVIKYLKNSGKAARKVFMIGDGYTDLVPFLEGVADDFLGFGAHKVRAKVQTQAPHFFDNSKALLDHLTSNVFQ